MREVWGSSPGEISKSGCLYVRFLTISLKWKDFSTVRRNDIKISASVMRSLGRPDEKPWRAGFGPLAVGCPCMTYIVMSFSAGLACRVLWYCICTTRAIWRTGLWITIFKWLLWLRWGRSVLTEMFYSVVCFKIYELGKNFKFDFTAPLNKKLVPRAPFSHNTLLKFFWCPFATWCPKHVLSLPNG